jgi:uncharacterized protein YkwD
MFPTRKVQSLDWIRVSIARCLVSFLAVAGLASTASGQTGLPVARLISASPVSNRSAVLEKHADSPAPPSNAPAAKTHVSSVPLSSKLADMERRAFELVNAQRVSNGQEPLEWDDQLCSMARDHSSNMVTLGYFDHVSPNGKGTVDRARELGVRGWHALAENIALNQGYDDPAEFAVEGWMNSPRHRSNILYPRFNRSAIGIAKAADGTVYFTQVFISR